MQFLWSVQVIVSILFQPSTKFFEVFQHIIIYWASTPLVTWHTKPKICHTSNMITSSATRSLQFEILKCTSFACLSSLFKQCSISVFTNDNVSTLLTVEYFLSAFFVHRKHFGFQSKLQPIDLTFFCGTVGLSVLLNFTKFRRQSWWTSMAAFESLMVSFRKLKKKMSV